MAFQFMLAINALFCKDGAPDKCDDESETGRWRRIKETHSRVKCILIKIEAVISAARDNGGDSSSPRLIHHRVTYLLLE